MLSGTPGIPGRGATLGAPRARRLAESASVTCLGGPRLVRRERSYLPSRRRLGSGEYGFPSNHSSVRSVAAPGGGALASTMPRSHSAPAASCVCAERPPRLNLRHRRLQSLVHAM
jgi:hypothetical protein